MAGRAARLHLTHARVSQVIKQQERKIGAELFYRTSRSVRLTRIGEQLRDELLPLYAGLKDSMRRARLAAQGVTGVLRVGMLPVNAHDLRPYWDAFRARHPQWRLHIQSVRFGETFAPLRRGDIDVMVAWLPVEEPDLTVGPVLFTDHRVLAVSADHELARRTSVSLEMVADFQHPDSSAVPGYWYDSYAPRQTRRGRMIERGPVVQDAEDALIRTSMAEIVTLFPAHVTRYWVRPGIAYLPVKDVGALPYAMVWRSGDTDNELIRSLARVAHDLGSLKG
ncbi:LysR family transcriptional regulator [Nonomuraea gerenzanensis]|uniref:LysR family transcriptional regulator n=1 Tax=Nonomuraea gerenzanensis TaxID=93944 RepID=UPI001CDA005F|nr:LysR family transcriptional regulator [Nonomuraea gerenzanensis]UBU10377.1 LysR family transcriptional regulator [Nonomuraea gerenzanensis]